MTRRRKRYAGLTCDLRTDAFVMIASHLRVVWQDAASPAGYYTQNFYWLLHYFLRPWRKP